MKSYLIKIMLFFIIVGLLGMLFFLWASSSSLSKEDTTKISTNSLDQRVASDSTFSVLTYNIGHLSGLYTDTSVKNKDFYATSLKKISEKLSSENPDIIAFQDIDFDSKRSFHVNQPAAFGELGYNHLAQAVYWDKRRILSPYWPISKQTGKVLSGLAVLSKYEILNHDRLTLADNLSLPFYKKAFRQDRIAQVVQLDLKGVTLTLINVHLEDYSKSAREPQFSYVVDLFKKHAKKTPTILLGDFNSSIKKDDALIHSLFNMPDVGYANYKNLDYILFTKNSIKMIDSRVANEFEGLANHVPVLLEFTLN